MDMSGLSGVTYQAKLPLAWQLAAPDDGMLANARHANLDLLRGLATLESIPDKDHTLDPAMAKAIDRIEAKLDIALNLLSGLVAQRSEPIAHVPVILSINKIEWQSSAELPLLDTSIKLALYLSAKLPQPLQLYARVTELRPDACVAEFIDRDEEYEEWITRTLFRYHRRELQARRQH